MLLNSAGGLLFLGKAYSPVRTSRNANAVEITLGLIYGSNTIY
jgi:hypothetical protein